MSTFGSSACWWADVVHFLKTGTRRYGVLERESGPNVMVDPAPGYDDSSLMTSFTSSPKRSEASTVELGQLAIGLRARPSG